MPSSRNRPSPSPRRASLIEIHFEEFCAATVLYDLESLGRGGISSVVAPILRSRERIEILLRTVH